MLDSKEIIDDSGQPLIVIEVPICVEMIQDCYMFNAMDAPSELKRMLLEEVALKIDDIILKHDIGKNFDKEFIKNKLNQVSIRYS